MLENKMITDAVLRVEKIIPNVPPISSSDSHFESLSIPKLLLWIIMNKGTV